MDEIWTERTLADDLEGRELLSEVKAITRVPVNKMNVYRNWDENHEHPRKIDRKWSMISMEGFDQF